MWPKHLFLMIPLLLTGAFSVVRADELPASAQPAAPTPHILKAASSQGYVDTFNRNDRELYPQHIPNKAAWGFLSSNVPLFECPDKDIEEIYYFRWWTFRKHIKSTPDGFIITEFLPPVGWSGKHNSISCAAGHHLREGRWLNDPRYLDDYSVFWFRKGGSPRTYSFWAADSVLARYQVTGDDRWAKALLPDLIKNYEAWEGDHRDANGLFWQVGSSATIGTTSVFKGNILAYTAITMNTGATLDGRALARNGAVALDGNTITVPTVVAPSVILVSAGVVTGSYTDAAGQSLDAATKTITVPVSGSMSMQFYRIRSGTALTITGISVSGGNVVITYN